MSAPRLALLMIVAASMASVEAQQWTQGPIQPPMLLERQGHTMVYDSVRARTVLFGGGGSGSGNDTWEFDGATWIQGPLAPPALVPRQGHAMAFDVTRGRTVLFGGLDTTSLRNDTWEYDGSAWTPGPVGPPPTARYLHAMSFDSARARIVLFGGVASGYMNDTWEYDGAAWTAGPAAPAGLVPRGAHAMSYDSARGRTVLFGGQDYSQLHNDTWEYDGTVWVQGPAAPQGLKIRYEHAMVYDASRGRTVLFGGRAAQLLGDTWEYDGTAWIAGPAPPPGLTPRYQHAMCYDAARARTVLYGGADWDPRGDVWEFDGTAWAPGAEPSRGVAPRMGHAMCYDSARHRAVLFGGGSYGSPLRNDTWEFDGTSWTLGPVAPPGLTPRVAHAMCFDATRMRTVLFAGGNTAWLNDTWEYDGTTWAPGPASPAAPRAGHGMAFDSARGRTVVFGGSTGITSRLNDTWEYDGISWTPGPPAPAGLTPRGYGAMSYDSLRRRTVLFGGMDASYQRSAETWEYDGASWMAGPVAPAALTPRTSHAMAYDSAAGRIVLFGGYSGTSTNDTWELDGSSWTAGGAPPAGLGPRDGHAMAFDVLRARTVLFGGGVVGNDTWEYARASSSISAIAGMGLGPPNPNRVRVFTGSGLPTAVDFFAYAAGAWGVNVDSANVDGAYYAEILTGPGPGPQFGPQIRGFQRDGTSIAKLSFYAYGTLKYGVNPGHGYLDADVFDELLTTPGPGASFGPHVRGWNFDNAAPSPIANVSYFAYGTLKYGANVASASVDADAFGEILTGPGPGPVFAPQVRGWNYDAVSITPLAKINFDAFPTGQFGVGVAGSDVDADGYGEIVGTPGPGPQLPSQFRGFDFDGSAVAQLPGFDVTPFMTLYGGKDGLGDIQPDGRAELLAGRGRDPAAGSIVLPFHYDGGSLAQVPGSFVPFGTATYGVSVNGGLLGY